MLLSAIVDSSDDAIVSKDLNGVINSWNKGAERLFGYTAEEAVGQPIKIIIPFERWGEESDILARIHRGERVHHFETVRKRKDGSFIDISLTISPVKDAQGTIIGASKIARDITDRKRAEAALVASELKFRQLADSMPQIVWTADANGEINYQNERWFEFTARDRNEGGEQSWIDLLHPEDLQPCKHLWSECVRTGDPLNIEVRYWDRRANHWHWFMKRAVPVRDAEGKVLKWFGSTTDIDQQKRAQDDLRRANRDMEQFSYSATHDLQEPLRSVKIYSELIHARFGDQLDADATKYIEFMRQGATRMEMLVHDLMAYTELANFREPVTYADAGAALKFVLEELRDKIVETGATVTVGPMPVLRVHESHLKQLFHHLIENAIKYRGTDRLPEIAVTCEREEDHWHFEVKDNGIGIHPAYKEKIFGLFKRLHSEDEYSGTGIGLAICQRIIGQYHCRIWVESEPGRGTAFQFTLPS